MHSRKSAFLQILDFIDLVLKSRLELYIYWIRGRVKVIIPKDINGRSRDNKLRSLGSPVVCTYRDCLSSISVLALRDIRNAAIAGWFAVSANCPGQLPFADVSQRSGLRATQIDLHCH